MRITKRRLLLLGFLLATLLVLSACAGPQGLQGPVGPAGPPGPEGPQGPQGEAAPAQQSTNPAQAAKPEYVGAETCAGCHPAVASAYAKSGHNFTLNAVVNNARPAYPYSRIPQPPEGYTWKDITYVVGGFNWKALFLDKNGYIITGPPDASGQSGYLNQFNLQNKVLNMGPGWESFHSDQANLPYNCGNCHTTGYSSSGHQDKLEGITGKWAATGVQCEACHGPGSLHASNPTGVRLLIDRDSQACTRCHELGQTAELQIANGFISHHEQYGDLPIGKHALLGCLTCHDPHTGVVQKEQAGEPASPTPCESCHYQEATVQKVSIHMTVGVACIECHMPPMIESAYGDPAKNTADIRTHRVVIDPTKIQQINQDGSLATTAIALNSACRHCHFPGNLPPLTDQQLLTIASGYHASQVGK